MIPVFKELKYGAVSRNKSLYVVIHVDICMGAMKAQAKIFTESGNSQMVPGRDISWPKGRMILLKKIEKEFLGGRGHEKRIKQDKVNGKLQVFYILHGNYEI